MCLTGINQESFLCMCSHPVLFSLLSPHPAWPLVNGALFVSKAGAHSQTEQVLGPVIRKPCAEVSEMTMHAVCFNVIFSRECTVGCNYMQ